MAIICFVCRWVNVENFVHFSKKVPNSTLSMCNFFLKNVENFGHSTNTITQNLHNFVCSKYVNLPFPKIQTYLSNCRSVKP